MRIERREAAHYERGRRAARPTGIVLHTNVGTFGSTVAWFESPDSGVSAHYLVGLDGRVGQFVDEADTARHAGRVRTRRRPLRTPGGRREPVHDRDRVRGRRRSARGRAAREPVRTGAQLIAEVAARWRSRSTATTWSATVRSSPPRTAREPRRRPLAARRELASTGRRRHVVCLLPARNAGRRSRGTSSRSRARATVVALDDGSTDETRSLCEASPLVETLLENPRAGDLRGLGRHRQPPASARGGGGARARLDPLARRRRAPRRRTMPRAARVPRPTRSPDARTGSQHFRSWGEGAVRPALHVGLPAVRLAARPALPGERLHFNPIPIDIPRGLDSHDDPPRHLGAESVEALEERLAKYREADPGRRWPTDFGRLGERAGRDLPRWRRAPRRCRPSSPDPAGRAGPVVCLLPARNAAADLPGWFDSRRRFADAVVALDDGSTDDTSRCSEATARSARAR